MKKDELEFYISLYEIGRAYREQTGRQLFVEEGSRRLKAKWTAEFSKDLKAFYGL